MVNEVDAVTNHWAVLIGINFYVSPLRPLKGCVRDVEGIKQYLEAGSTPVNVDMFRASAPLDPDSRYPAGEADTWPTFENVTSSLKRITAKAKPGDFVYIHYAGHGTQMEASSSEYSNKNIGDLALVLVDDVHGCRYLRGLELAYLLNEMVKGGLFVTLVLDCCFSGSVLRLGDPHGDAIRAVDYDHAVDAAYPQCFSTSPAQQVNFSTLRDIRMLPSWLVDPTGYTILTACGPHEIAQELKFEGGERNGALSYFLLRALTSLRRSGVEITHQSLYQHLCIRFHASWPQQNPMRYGNKKFLFFGKLRSRPDIAFTSVLRTQKDNNLCLAAGFAHGVCKGDEYAIYPFDASEDASNNAKQASIEVRVDAVQGLTSDLVGVNQISAISQVKTGWKARPLTHLPPNKILVRYIDYNDDQSPWVAAAMQRRFLQFSIEDVESKPCLFNVIRNEQNEYEILDGSCQRITSLPTIPLDRNGALDSIVDLLDHLAAFKYIEGIENRIPMTSFEGSFRIHLSDGMGSDLEAAGRLDVKHNNRVSLRVQNTSDKPLYLYIYNLGPSWQIDGLICNDGGGDYKVVLPKNDMKGHTGQEKMTLQMTVPESFRDRGEHTCEDIVKVFITSRPSSFVALALPKIPISATNLDEPLRGNYNQLSKFLTELTTPFRGGEIDVSYEEWVTRSFVIRTHYDKDNASIVG